MKTCQQVEIRNRLYLSSSSSLNEQLIPNNFQFLIIGNGISRRDGYVLLSFKVLWLNNLICHSAFPSDTSEESVDNQLDEHEGNQAFQCHVE